MRAQTGTWGAKDALPSPGGCLGQTRRFGDCCLRGICHPFRDQYLLLPVEPAVSVPEQWGEPLLQQLQPDLHQGRICPAEGAEGGRGTRVRDPESANIPLTSCLKPS